MHLHDRLHKAYQAWSLGPKLLESGQPIAVFADVIQNATPRSAIGYDEPGYACVIAVNGRQPGYSKGMALAERSKAFYDLGCKNAYNLDRAQPP
ncbi:MAG: phosphodiester glycosidase family protein [Candidatus Pelethousia sp.]|nr:phosphodiester glycosidase family protein [Candidatus Pelethousia sp.]